MSFGGYPGSARGPAGSLSTPQASPVTVPGGLKIKKGGKRKGTGRTERNGGHKRKAEKERGAALPQNLSKVGDINRI